MVTELAKSFFLLLEISILSNSLFSIAFSRWKVCDSVRAFLRLKFRLPPLSSQNRARRKRLPIRGAGGRFDSLKMHFCSHSDATIEKKIETPSISSLKNHWTSWCRVCIVVTRSLSAVSSQMNKRKPWSMIGKIKTQKGIRKKETSANFTLKN